MFIREKRGTERQRGMERDRHRETERGIHECIHIFTDLILALRPTDSTHWSNTIKNISVIESAGKTSQFSYFVH